MGVKKQLYKDKNRTDICREAFAKLGTTISRGEVGDFAFQNYGVKAIAKEMYFKVRKEVAKRSKPKHDANHKPVESGVVAPPMPKKEEVKVKDYGNNRLEKPYPAPTQNLVSIDDVVALLEIVSRIGKEQAKQLLGLAGK